MDGRSNQGLFDSTPFNNAVHYLEGGYVSLDKFMYLVRRFPDKRWI